MKIGYARVSTQEQHLDLQLDALHQAGCEKIYQEQVSGAKTARPELDKALEQLRAGDTLVVWTLDRLGRSLPHLIDVVTTLLAKGVGLKSLKPHKDDHRYILTIPYKTDKELDCIIYDEILGEAHRIADVRNGHLEADVISLDDQAVPRPLTQESLVLSVTHLHPHASLRGAVVGCRRVPGEPPALRAREERQRVTRGCTTGVFRVVIPRGRR